MQPKAMMIPEEVKMEGKTFLARPNHLICNKLSLCVNCLNHLFRHVEDMFSAMQNADSQFENSRIHRSSRMTWFSNLADRLQQHSLQRSRSLCAITVVFSAPCSTITHELFLHINVYGKYCWNQNLVFYHLSPTNYI